MKKYKAPVATLPSRRERAALAAMVDCLVFIQTLFQLDHITFFALLGQTCGEVAAANDVEIEKKYVDEITKDEELQEPYRKTLLMNLEVVYNQCRSIAVKRDKVKPKREV